MQSYHEYKVQMNAGYCRVQGQFLGRENANKRNQRNPRSPLRPKRSYEVVSMKMMSKSIPKLRVIYLREWGNRVRFI